MFVGGSPTSPALSSDTLYPSFGGIFRAALIAEAFEQSAELPSRAAPCSPLAKILVSTTRGSCRRLGNSPASGPLSSQFLQGCFAHGCGGHRLQSSSTSRRTAGLFTPPNEAALRWAPHDALRIASSAHGKAFERIRLVDCYSSRDTLNAI